MRGAIGTIRLSIHRQRDRVEGEVGGMIAKVITEDILITQTVFRVELRLQQVSIPQLLDQTPHAVVGAGRQDADGDLAGDRVNEVQVQNRAPDAWNLDGVGRLVHVRDEQFISGPANAAVTGRGHSRNPVDDLTGTTSAVDADE